MARAGVRRGELVGLRRLICISCSTPGRWVALCRAVTCTSSSVTTSRRPRDGSSVSRSARRGPERHRGRPGLGRVHHRVALRHPTAGDLELERPGRAEHPDLVIVPVGAAGKIQLYNGSLGTVQLIADVAGYLLGTAPSAAPNAA